MLWLLLVLLPLLTGGGRDCTAAVTPFGEVRAPPPGAGGAAVDTTGRVHTFAFFCPVLAAVAATG